MSYCTQEISWSYKIRENKEVTTLSYQMTSLKFNLQQMLSVNILYYKNRF